MKAVLILADATQADAAGKLHALGAGWAVTSTPTPPMGLMVIIDCPWDQTNTQHKIVIDLLDADGRPVSFEAGPMGDPIPAMHIEGDLEAGRPPGMPAGTPIRQTLAIGMAGGMPLAPGKYEFHMTIDGQHVDSWTSTFTVQQQQPGLMPPM